MASTAAIQSAWTLQSLDTALVGRFHDGALVPSTNQVAATSFRSGIIGTSSTTGLTVANDFGVTPTTTPSMAVVVEPGYAALARTGDAPYVVANIANQTLTVATSNPTNPRLDLVYLQVLDAVAGDASTATQVGIVTGTPAGTPVLPSLPSTGVCIPIVQVAVAANATTIVAGNIADIRPSTSFGGMIRLLAGGDTLASAGNRIGEQRQRVLSTYPNTPVVTDVWGTDGKWHGTRPIPLDTMTFPTSVGTYTDTSTHTFAQIVVPDPGYAYTLVISGHSQLDNYTGAVGGLFALHCASTDVASGVPGAGPTTWLVGDLPAKTDATVRTGATTVQLNYTASPSESWTFNGNDGGTWLSVTVHPT